MPLIPAHIIDKAKQKKALEKTRMRNKLENEERKKENPDDYLEKELGV